MEFVIHRKPDLRRESIALAKQVFNAAGSSTVEELLARNSRLSRPELEALYTDIDALYHGAKGLELEGEKTALLLKTRDEQETTWADVFNMLAVYREAGLTDIYRILNLVFDHETTEQEGMPAPMPMPEFFAWLETTDYDDQGRYDLLRLAQDFAAYEACMEDVIARAGEYLRVELPRFRGRIEETMDRLEKELTEGGLGFLAQMVNLKLDEEVYHFFPSVVMPNALAITMLRELDIYRLQFGICVFPYSALAESGKNREARLQGALKAMADPTKMSILRMLKEGRRYSAELAESTGLTGATISHHMTSLVNDRLVTLEKVGNRVYYELDRESISRQLALLGGLLLG